jgi:hypothetical protein
MARRIEVVRDGCPVRVAGEARVRDVAGDHLEVIISDLRTDGDELVVAGVGQPRA